MTIKDLLVGKKVRITEACNGTKIGEIYRLRMEMDKCLYAGNCYCLEKWEPLDPISYKPKPHKHTYKCVGCGEEKKK